MDDPANMDRHAMAQDGHDHGTVAQLLLDLLHQITTAPDQSIDALVSDALTRLPGVDAARLHPEAPEACTDTNADTDADTHADTDADTHADTHADTVTRLAITAGATSHGTLHLRVNNATAFAAAAPALRQFCTTLAQLLEARRLMAIASDMEAHTRELHHSEKRFRDLFDCSPDPCWLIDKGVFTDCNRAAIRILGYAHRDEILQHPSRISPEFQPDGQPSFEKAEQMMANAMRDGITRFEWEHRRADGSCFPVEITLARIELQGHDILYCVWRDITDRKRAEDQAYSLAFFDPLTDLPNRRLLVDRLQQSMATSARNGKHRALLYLDLDQFKNLNDTQGHEVGDRLLQDTARKLRACVREGDTVARLGGDEFVVLVQQLATKVESAIAQVSSVAQKIIAHLADPVDLGQTTHQGSASIGVTLFSGHDITVDEVLKRADLAMYQAKAAGRNTVRFFDPAMQARITTRTTMERELRNALKHKEFVLHYQPQVDRNGRCTGVEALIRWHHPKRGLVPPGEFIPLAEETGLILPMGQWVLDEACRTLTTWQTDPLTARLDVAVNVSARQFREPDFVADICARLKAGNLGAGRLKIEITESMLLEDIEQTIDTMLALKQAGVTFALDDFGTGYSSLYYVKRLPLDQLKIDQSFVRDILTDPNDAAICRAIIALGRSLGLLTIAEGVETEAQQAFLIDEGCDGAQGYLYARPMPEADVLAWMRSHA
jgi:diguanylate cyclase (GGDEF)-like protein/PAS domain S-box-containing protein